MAFLTNYCTKNTAYLMKLHRFITKRGSNFNCRRCIRSFYSPEVLAKHNKMCEKNNVAILKFPKQYSLSWKKVIHKKPIYFNFFADFEWDNEKYFETKVSNEIENKITNMPASLTLCTANVFMQKPKCNGYYFVSKINDGLKFGFFRSSF